ncbi:MAG: ABC transporter ATP-binding protein [Oscillospiraceae bacterium]|nr:ABC transporter ATP-binding protein [Oscillospiraceae bacterium]
MENETLKKRIRPKYSAWSNCLWMLGRAWRTEKSVLVLAALLVVMGTAQSLLQLLAAPMVVRAVENRLPLPQLLGVIFAFAGGLVVCAGMIGWLQTNQYNGRMTVRTQIRVLCKTKLWKTSYANLQQPSFLSAAHRAQDATNDYWNGVHAVWDYYTELLTAAFCFLVWSTLLIGVDPLLLAVTAITSLLGFLGENLGWHRARRFTADQGGAVHRLKYIDRCARDTVLAKDLRLYHMQPMLENAVADASKTLYHYMHKFALHRFLGFSVSPCMDLIRNSVAYAYLLSIVLKNEMTAAQFLLAFSAVTALGSRLADICTFISNIKTASQDISHVREFLDIEEPFLFKNGTAVPAAPDGKYIIRLRDVSYRYPGAENDTLSHIDLTLSPGEKLAVVGLNGAGKTTLIKLLCGFLDPTEGEVLLNGQDIRQYDRRQYYALFSAVWQQHGVLAMSIAENVACTAADSPAFDRTRVEECLDKAGLSAKIRSLPNGFASLLGKAVHLDAVQLSGGEEQRLLLARALYKDAPFIVLDEPTAALDPIAESEIYQRYDQLTAGKSAVYISHRLASTRFCDRIILIADGGFAECGSHEELIAANGRYAELYEIQSRYYKSEEEAAEHEQ